MISRGAHANVTETGAGRTEYQRVLLKLSGEAFAPSAGTGISTDSTALVARQLAEAAGQRGGVERGWDGRGHGVHLP